MAVFQIVPAVYYGALSSFENAQFQKLKVVRDPAMPLIPPAEPVSRAERRFLQRSDRNNVNISIGHLATAAFTLQPLDNPPLVAKAERTLRLMSTC
jgi:hypothetical protein